MTAPQRQRAAFWSSSLFLCSICGFAALWQAAGPWSGPRAIAQEAGPTKRAILVGINAYNHPKLGALKFAENDAREMGDVLTAQGYMVEVLTGAKATKAGVEGVLKRVIDECKKGDTVLVGLAGHGLQFLGQADCFYVPVDGKPFKDETVSLVSLNGVYEQLDKSFAGIKVLLVDACRDDPSTTRGIDADTAPRPPQGVAALFSCKAGERAFEHKDLQHGVFFHFVLEGLKGKAKDEDGEVTFAGLTAYVSKNVSRTVPKLIAGGAEQSPTLQAKYSREPILAKIDLKPVPPPKPTGLTPTPMPTTVPTVPVANTIPEGEKAGEERVFSDLKIKMNWCPPGTFTMGSPKSEGGHYDDEDQVSVTLSRGFWLGQTEVTQGLWESVMGFTPWNGKDFVKEGASYPATWVSHEDAAEFCGKLTERERKAAGLPSGTVYRLPTEAEWEYACRAGTQARYSLEGNGTLSDYAWYKGNTAEIGESYAHRVGNRRPNPWGFFDMHGNVWEWCGDWYADKLAGGSDPRGPFMGSSRVFRGGSWFSKQESCRSAYRLKSIPGSRRDDLGFRVLLNPSSLKQVELKPGP